jgi:hypothetical protein
MSSSMVARLLSVTILPVVLISAMRAARSPSLASAAAERASLSAACACGQYKQ